MNKYSLSKPSFLNKKKKSYLHKLSLFPYILVLYSRKRDFSHIIPLLHSCFGYSTFMVPKPVTLFCAPMTTLSSIYPFVTQCTKAAAVKDYK